MSLNSKLEPLSKFFTFGSRSELDGAQKDTETHCGPSLGTVWTSLCRKVANIRARTVLIPQRIVRIQVRCASDLQGSSGLGAESSPSAVRKATPRRSIHISRFNVLGWQRFAGVEALSRLEVTSRNFKEVTRCHLLTSLADGITSATATNHERKLIQRLLQALGELAPRGHLQAISVAATCVADSDSQIRRCSLGVLRQLSGKGDPIAIKAVVAAVAKHLEASSPNVRAAGIAALGHFAQRGDSAIVPMVASHLEDSVLSVRMAATDALRKICERGCESTAQLVVVRLKHEEPSVREAALIALERLVDKGDPRAIAAIADAFQVESTDVRRDLMTALNFVSDKGNAVAFFALLPFLDDDNLLLRIAAVSAIGEIAKAGDVTAISALASRLTDEDPVVRKTSVNSIGKIAPRGSDAAQEMFLRCLKDEDHMVRMTAIQALGRTTEDGANDITTQVAECLQDWHQRVREAAADALGRFVNGGNAKLFRRSRITWSTKSLMCELLL